VLTCKCQILLINIGTCSSCTGSECQGGADGTQNVNDTDKDSSKREESALTLEKEDASPKECLELSNTEESFVEGPKQRSNPTAQRIWIIQLLHLIR